MCISKYGSPSLFCKAGTFQDALQATLELEKTREEMRSMSVKGGFFTIKDMGDVLGWSTQLVLVSDHFTGCQSVAGFLKVRMRRKDHLRASLQSSSRCNQRPRS